MPSLLPEDNEVLPAIVDTIPATVCASTTVGETSSTRSSSVKQNGEKVVSSWCAGQRRSPHAGCHDAAINANTGGYALFDSPVLHFQSDMVPEHGYCFAYL